METVWVQILLSSGTLVVAIVVSVSATRARGDERAKLINDRMDAINRDVDAVTKDFRIREEAMSKAVQTEFGLIHGRINDVRETFVRRDDFAEAMRRIEQGQRDTKDEVSRLRHEQRSLATTVAAIAHHLNVRDQELPKPRPLPQSGD